MASDGVRIPRLSATARPLANPKYATRPEPLPLSRITKPVSLESQMREPDCPESSREQQRHPEQRSSQTALFNKVFHAHVFDSARSSSDPLQVLEDPA